MKKSIVRKGFVLGIIVLFICSGFFNIPAVTNEDLPDLTIESMTAPDTAFKGENVTVNVTIINIGDGEVPVGIPVEVGLFIDNEYYPISMNVTYDGFSSGTVRYFHLFWIAEIGNHSLLVFVDYNNLIDESDELNNEKVKFIDVFGGPLLVYVDDDFDESTPGWNVTCFDNIQTGVDAVAENGTVYVFNGTYYENVIVNKSIDLIGENKTGTIIDGRRKGDTVHVIAKDVTLSGFTVKNGSLGNEKNGSNWYYAGIRLTASNSIICGNILRQNTLGIFGKKVTNITIFNNDFIGDGVTFSLYDVGSASTSFCRKYFIHTIYNNTVNGKPLVYLEGESDKIIDDAGQIILVSCTNITIRGVNLTNADFGCILVNCSNCLVKDSNISSGDGMLWLIHSNNNRIQNNRISYNFEGVCLDCKSTQNFIISNTISNNDWCGIIVEDGSNFNKIIKNNFIENKYNAVFNNSFFNRWARNYWNRPWLLPKIIFGKIKIGSIEIPWVNTDLRPALKPYEIGV